MSEAIISGRPPQRGQTVQLEGSGTQVLFDDTTTTDVVYYGKAAPGTAQSDARWQVFIWDKATSPYGKKYANGSPDFDKKWSSRATYTYTVS